MRGYYASYGDTFTPYEFYKPQVHATSLVLPHASTYNSRFDGNECTIDVNLAVGTKYSVPKNSYDVKLFLDNLKSAGTTEIPKLDNFFRIAIAYAVVNNWTGEVVDDTVQIQYAKGETALLELGLDESEFIARPALHVKGSVSRAYSSKIPYGVMLRQIDDHNSYAICIKKIVISQAVTASLDMKPVNKHADFARHMTPLSHPGKVHGDIYDLPHPYYHPKEPEIQYGNCGNRIVNPYTDYVVVYDTEADNMVFEPITTKRLSNLIIRIDFVTTRFAAILQESVDAILKQNAAPIPPITKPDKEETEKPEDNTDVTADPIPPVDDPDSPYDKDNQDTGSGTGEPTDTEGTGDASNTGESTDTSSDGTGSGTDTSETENTKEPPVTEDINNSTTDDGVEDTTP